MRITDESQNSPTSGKSHKKVKRVGMNLNTIFHGIEAASSGREQNSGDSDDGV